MNRIKSAHSDVTDADLDGYGEREVEFQRLSRQIRIMEGDRRAYSQESQELINRQKSEISGLERERLQWLQDLRVIESRSNQMMDEKNTEGLETLGNEKKSIEDMIKQERSQHEELNAQARDAEKKIRDQHKGMGGINMSRGHIIKTQKNVRKLENQLSHANNKFCEALDTNKELREEIDSLRVERKRFDMLHKKLEKELHQFKMDIGEVIDQSIQAYESRDEAQAKMIMLKDKADKDVQQHTGEKKELVRIIDHDRKLREFMNTKSKERQEDPQLVIWRQKKEALEAERKKASQVDSVETYETAFARIKEITNEEEIDKLVSRFIEAEDKNFALFNFVNEQNNQVETLQEQIVEKKEEIEKFKAQGVELEVKRQSILKELEERQTVASKLSSDNSEKFTGVMKILDQLRAGIESLFGKINCDRTSIDDLLGAQSGVTDQNMIQYLGIVEERTNQLLLVRAYLTSQKDYDEYQRKQLTLLGEGPLPQPQSQTVVPPGVADDNDSDTTEHSDEETRPFNRNELIQKAMKSVRKREAMTKKEGVPYDPSENKDKKKKDKKGKH